MNRPWHNGVSSRPGSGRPRLLRRLVIFAAALLFLGLSGLGLLLLRWSGQRGAPAAGRLYVQGDFERTGRLVSLEREYGTGEAPLVPVRLGNACYRVEVEGDPRDDDRDAQRVCRGKPLRIWVEDALLDLTVGARGVPRVSIAGVRAREGDWLGSLADSSRPHPRVPLRAQGVPGRAARVVACPAAGEASTELCLEVHDRLGRLAIARGSGVRAPGAAPTSGVELPGHGDVVRLNDGDALWLGLVAFVARHSRAEDVARHSRANDVARAGGHPPALILDRVDRLRPRRRAGEPRAGDLGGDRRWLGRLWHVESPDPSAEVPDRLEIYPMRQRYTPHNLSRQRTNLEGEDLLQRLIDGGWLCLESLQAGDPRLVWRALDQPGCAGSRPAGLTRAAIEDYRRARYGDLSYLAGSLISAANVALAAERYLDDATELPFVFDWRLSYRRGGVATDSGASHRRVPQPAPSRLWGVRFGTTRQVRRSLDFNRGLPPTVLPRSSTARHLLQVLRSGELLASFYLPATHRRGGVCLGRHDTPEEDHTRHGANLFSFRPTSGNHHALGSVAFLDDPQTGTWSPDPDTACNGCLLAIEVTGDAAGLTVTPAGSCQNLSPPATAATSPGEPVPLAHGEELAWGDYRLRHVERGERPWLAATDPGTGRRHFAEELYLRGRLRPVLGDAAALSGVEAALRELLADSGDAGVSPRLETLELTIDGDLQLAAAAIVDALARPQVAEDDPEPHRVSVTAAILDAGGGDLLAAVNWSSQGSEEGHRGAWSKPTTWELGSGQADVLENAALLRRGAIGSTMKIAGSYALLNNDSLLPGEELTRHRAGYAFLEAPIGRGRLYLHRGVETEQPSGRRCSTGPHYLPAGDAGFTSGTFIRRFAASCNNFFVMTGLRHASNRPATLRQLSTGPAAAGPQELLLDLRRGDQPTLIGPSPEVRPLAERIRDGLAGDFAPGSGPPKSLYGILFRLGFQPRRDLFTAQGEAPAELAFDHRGRQVAVPLANDWFSPTGTATPATPATPALRPGRDFSYPGVPSPGRLDQATTRGQPVLERYDGNPHQVKRHAEGRADVQWAMLMIGQSSVEASALGLAGLYAPAARADGKAVSPCLFRANCGPHRAGARVIDPTGPDAEILGRALSAVLSDGTARGGLLRAGRRHLPDRGWGGKTGTYQVEHGRPVGLSAEQWQQLRAWSCGVGGVARPPIASDHGDHGDDDSNGGRVAELANLLSRAPAGSGLGARICEDSRLPLNPGGIHSYRSGELPARLDELAAELERTAETETLIYHSFVTLMPPGRGGPEGVGKAAEGIVIAVLVDRQTADKSTAIQIGAELAAAVERWAGAGAQTESLLSRSR